MTDYATAGDAEELHPETGYAVVAIDEFNPSDSSDFITALPEFEDADCELPPEREGYTDVVHCADGERFARSEWPPTD